jgi:hypothetical protein
VGKLGQSGVIELILTRLAEAKKKSTSLTIIDWPEITHP